jgi:hypothetical protein
MMKNTFANARGAYWVAIVAASLTFTTHAVQGAKAMKQPQRASVKPLAAAPSQANSIDPLLTAAYRDGLYVAKLAVQRGEQRLAPVGRWATQTDRDAFLAGYEQSSAEIAEATSREN